MLRQGKLGNALLSSARSAVLYESHRFRRNGKSNDCFWGGDNSIDGERIGSLIRDDRLMV